MRAGALKHRITIQQSIAGQDGYGEPVKSWSDVAAVWADVRDMTGREFLAAQAVQAGVTTKITIRYRPGVTAAMRVLHGADVYNIQAVLGTDRVSLLLMCERGVNHG